MVPSAVWTSRSGSDVPNREARLSLPSPPARHCGAQVGSSSLRASEGPEVPQIPSPRPPSPSVLWAPDLPPVAPWSTRQTGPCPPRTARHRTRVRRFQGRRTVLRGTRRSGAGWELGKWEWLVQEERRSWGRGRGHRVSQRLRAIGAINHVNRQENRLHAWNWLARGPGLGWGSPGIHI